MSLDTNSDPQSPPQPIEPTKIAVLKHRRGSRWMHWINFPLIVIMIWSGLRIYWANRVYAFGILSWEWFMFFPESFYTALDLNQRLARGIAFHFTFAWLFTLNGIAFVIYTWRTGEWREMVPNRKSLRGSLDVLLHDLRIRKTEPPKRGRYNEAQRLTYSLVIFLGFLAILSGFAIFKPTQLSILTWILGGYTSARVIHFAVTIAFVLFFLVHILQVARAGWRNFTSMVTGYEVTETDTSGSNRTSPARQSMEAADG
ncbi:MAG: cytochrome b/b6 domain-containing protein [Acidimicrobiia bacterium]|nr:cytochrome b/b6 domain-containing protein [Acidimicrobiia bacterium]